VGPGDRVLRERDARAQPPFARLRERVREVDVPRRNAQVLGPTVEEQVPDDATVALCDEVGELRLLVQVAPVVEVLLVVGGRQAGEARRARQVEVELPVVRGRNRRVLGRARTNGHGRLDRGLDAGRLPHGEGGRDPEAETEPGLDEVAYRRDVDEV